MNQYRIGIVGCGEVTQIIQLPSLFQLPDQFTVTAICDISEQVLQAVGDQWRVAKRVRDYRNLVSLEEVDAVLIANPNAYHAQAALSAIEARKHVLVEEPMSINLREADDIIAAQQRAGVVVQVGYMCRYAPAFLEACRLVRQLGPIRYARVHDVFGSNSLIIRATSRVIRGRDIPAETVAESQRLQTALFEEAVGEAPPELRVAYGQLLGLSTHDISAMRELLGMPMSVLYAAQRQGGRYITAAFDYNDYICQFETGVDSISRFDASLEVYGGDQVLRVQYDTPYVRNLPIRLHLLRANSGGGVVESAELPAWGDAFQAEWQSFYESINGNCSPKTSPVDFRQDLELFQAMIACMKP